MRLFQVSTILTVLLLLLGDLFYQEAIAQNMTDRRSSEIQQSQPPSLDISRGSSSFNFIDEIGFNLGLEGLGTAELLDIETYLLGPGDLISISMSGNVNGIFRGLIINPQGELIIPNIGILKIEGLLLAEAQEKIADAVKSNFLDTEIHVSIERPRMIQIHIVGDVPFTDDVPFNGSRIIPSQTRLNRVIPSLSRSMVLEGRFSMRDITITRKGEDISADLVAYMLSGEMSGNPKLMHDDVIRIHNRQTYAPQISVSGAVKSPLLLEYRADDSVAGLLKMAGGLAADANPDNIELVRRSQDGSLSRISVNYNDHMTPLQPNDRLVVGFDRDRRAHQSAWVYGEAESPGNFPIVHGETTALELLEMAGGLTNNALPQAAYLVRAKPLSNIFDGESVEKEGTRMINERGVFTFSEHISIEENPRIRNILINASFSAERLKRVSDQFIEGLEYLNLESVLNRNEVYIDLNNPEQLASVIVYGGDELYIPRDEKTVFLFGQVNNPGYYTFESGKSAESYVRSAGGFARAADVERVFVIKAGNMAWYPPDETTIESGDIVFVDREPFDNLVTAREYEFQRRELRNRNLQLIISGVATVASVITAYVAVTR